MPNPIAELRLALQAGGYAPIPLRGKRPFLHEWSSKTDVPASEVTAWPPGNTGVITRTTPAIDIDIKHAEEASAVEALVRDWFEGRGVILTRFGDVPKRAILCRTDAPFEKISASFVAADGSRHKVEVLADGQQLVVDGIHPDTKKPYVWHGDYTPWKFARSELPELNDADARELVALISEMLREQFGFQPAWSNGHDATGAAPAALELDEVETALQAMTFGGGEECGIHWTQFRCVNAMLKDGIPVADVFAKVWQATQRAAQADPNVARWKWGSERRAICELIESFIAKYPDSVDCLPPDQREKFLAALKGGGRPRVVVCPRRGVFVYVKEGQSAEPAAADHVSEPRTPKESGKIRFKLTPLHELQLDLDEQTYLVDELIPIAGLVDLWGKAKAYKSFFVFDLMLHVAMGWEYRDRQVQQGEVIYCAFEGAHGYRSRKAAAFKHYDIEDNTSVPLHIMSGNVNLIKDHSAMIRDFTLQLSGKRPVAVVLDTLNKSLFGSESSDEDMGNYVRAAEAIRDAFGCVVIIVHHCGYDDTHPRGHTSLPGAVDAQLKVAKVDDTTFTVTVEMMRDGPEEIEIVSQMKPVDLGLGPNGKMRTSLVVMPCGDPAAGGNRKWPRGMTIFVEALREALQRYGEHFQVVLGTPPEQAVDLEKLRECFYSQYPVTSDTEEKRQAARRQAFNRDLRNARNAKLIGSRDTPGGKTMVWATA